MYLTLKSITNDNIVYSLDYLLIVFNVANQIVIMVQKLQRYVAFSICNAVIYHNIIIINIITYLHGTYSSAGK